MHWRRKWQRTPVFLPGESQGRGILVGCPVSGSHRVRHYCSDLAAAAAAAAAAATAAVFHVEIIFPLEPILIFQYSIYGPSSC